jgi:hypothetical protein
LYCIYHKDRLAEQICAGCGKSLCKYCSQAVFLGEYYCFLCSMLISRSVPDESSRDKRTTAGGMPLEMVEGKGPLHYFCIVTFVMVIVMIGVIIG